MMTDNDGTRKLSENPGFHGRTKHINIHYHYIRSQLRQGELTIDWTPGGKIKADLLTKSLARPKLGLEITTVLGKRPTLVRGSVGKGTDVICAEMR
jgi:hypothetical protein